MAKVDVQVVNRSDKSVGVRLDEERHKGLIERLQRRGAAEKLKEVQVKKGSEPKKTAQSSS